MGVAGAGLASTIAIAAGVAMLVWYFERLEKYVTFHRDQWKPNFAYWKRILNIGLPAGGEFFLMFLTMGLTYWLHPPLRRGGAGGLRHRPARDAGDLPACDGGGVLCGADRRAELRCAPGRPGARDVSHRGAARNGHHGRDHVAVSDRAAGADLSVQQRSEGHRGGHGLPAHHLVELHRERHHLHLLRHVPGDGQHVAGAA